MITVRRAQGGRRRRRAPEAWRALHPQDRADPLAAGLGALERLDEDHLPPGAGLARHPPHAAELLTYVCEGSLAFEDSLGGSGVICAGEFQRTTTGRGVRRDEANASRTDWAHVLRIWLRPAEEGLDPGHELRRFCAAERRNALCLVASPDGRGGSLRLHQDALVYSAVLDPGQHVVHELWPGRSAWLHLVHGEVRLGDVILTAGDGAGATDERAVSLTARTETELLLLDLGAGRRARAGAGAALRPIGGAPSRTSGGGGGASAVRPPGRLGGGARLVHRVARPAGPVGAGPVLPQAEAPPALDAGVDLEAREREDGRRVRAVQVGGPAAGDPGPGHHGAACCAGADTSRPTSSTALRTSCSTCMACLAAPSDSRWRSCRHGGASARGHVQTRRARRTRLEGTSEF